MKKYFISDIDGTLVPFKKKEVPEENINTIRNHKDFFNFVLTTGLPRESYILPIIKKVEPKYCIYSGGALLIDEETQEVIFSQSISSEVFTLIKNIIMKYNLFFTDTNRTKYFYCHEISEIDREIIEKFELDYSTEFNKINEVEIDEIFSNLHRVHIMGKAENMEIINKELMLVNSIRAVFDKKTGMIINITHSDSTKEKALRKLEEHLSISFKENAVSIGDSEVDLEMLSMTKYSFSLEDSTEAVKEKVHYIVPSSEKSGLAQAIIISKKLMYN